MEMASYVSSLFTALIASLVCQMATSSELTRSYSETTATYSEYVTEEMRNLKKLSNKNKETYETTDASKNDKELNVELVSRIFDTSPLTLTKFTEGNSNVKKTNRHVTDITDGTNSHEKIQKALEESRPKNSSISDKDVSENVKLNETNENGEKCNAHKKREKVCDDSCKMAASKNITTKETSNNPEQVESIGNSSTGVISVNDTEKFSKILEESDTAKMIMRDFSKLNRLEVAARLFDDPTPLKTQDEAGKADIKDDENYEQTIQPITVSFYKRVMPYMTDLPKVMESTEVTTTEVESDVLHEAIESDSVTSNAEKPITFENEEKKNSNQRGESLESAATLKFADSAKVDAATEALRDSVGKAGNSSDDKSNSQDVKVSQAPQARLYADDKRKKKEDVDERDIQEYLKKANDRWINIIINNYPSNVCNKEKM